MTKIHIATGVDEAGVAQLFAVARSIGDNLAPTSSADYHVLYDGSLSPLANRLARSHFGRLRIRLVQVENALRSFPAGHPHVSSASFIKIQVSSLLGELDKVIVLDNDVIALSDLTRLFSVDLRGKAIAGVIDYPAIVSLASERDAGEARILRHMSDIVGLPGAMPPYINAGVLLFDLSALRRIGFEQRAMAALMSNRGDLIWGDQDAINIVGKGNILFLDPRWNAISGQHLRKDLAAADAGTRNAITLQSRDPFIVHYAGSDKPWKPACERDRSADWWHYAVRSGAQRELSAEYSMAGRPIPEDRRVRRNIGSLYRRMARPTRTLLKALVRLGGQ